MHYVKHTQKAIVSCLPKTACGATSRSVLLRSSPQLRNHAFTLQAHSKNQRRLSSQGTGPAKVPDGDDALQSLLSAMPSTKSTKSKHNIPPQRISRFAKRPDAQEEKRIKGISLTERHWHNKSAEELLGQLKDLASELRLRECDLLARYMIWQRGYKPDRDMYASLILANGSTDGSASTVRSLLDQMKKENISLGAAECLTVLKVLAVHPDYVLRADTIQYMERGWHGLSDDTHHLIIAGMLRGLQLEQAVDELENMVRNEINVAPWLYDLTVAVLVNVGELEEALRVMRMRLENVGPEELNTIWTFMLEAAAESFNYTVTQYVWKRCVTTEYINPTSGTCRHVLNMAARQGDVTLATDAFRVLHKHHAFPSLEHYEMLFEAQINGGDIESALKLLCEMHADKYTPNHASTRPLYMWLMDNPTVNPADYFHKVLSKFEVQGLAVPVAAANVLIEACAVQHRARWDDAFRMYERIREVCAEGADITTFYHMFDLCRATKSVSWPYKLADEYRAMKLAPDAIVYDGIIGAALHARHPLDRVLAHWDEMARVGVRPLQRTLAALYRALRAVGHPRVAEVEAELERVFAPRDVARVRAAGDRAAEAGSAPSPWEEEEAVDASIYPPNRVAEMDGFFREMKDTVLDDPRAGSGEGDFLERSVFGEAEDVAEEDVSKPTSKTE